jgi:dTDP-4-amino-4,6-dideoxygalactose transaminase
MINHSNPYFDGSDEKALLAVLKRGHVTSGKIVKTFGHRLASLLGRKWAIPLQSGTDSIVLALKILNLKKSAKIAIPAYTCGAILDAIAILNLRPVLVDISRETLAMDVDFANRADCDAVIAAHLFGVAAPLFRINHENLIEDCAQCLGISGEGVKAGSMGKLSLSSFYGTKIIAAGHGGVLAGDDERLFKTAMNILVHDKVEEWIPHLHFMMSDLNAALGLSQLRKIKFLLRRRRKIAATYIEALGKKTVLPKNEMFFRFNVVPIKNNAESLIQTFGKNGIEAKKPVYKPVFKLLKMSGKNYPNAKWADENLVSVPIYPSMKDDDVRRITDFLRKNKDEMRRWPPA